MNKNNYCKIVVTWLIIFEATNFAFAQNDINTFIVNKHINHCNNIDKKYFFSTIPSKTLYIYNNWNIMLLNNTASQIYFKTDSINGLFDIGKEKWVIKFKIDNDTNKGIKNKEYQAIVGFCNADSKFYILNKFYIKKHFRDYPLNKYSFTDYSPSGPYKFHPPIEVGSYLKKIKSENYYENNFDSIYYVKTLLSFYNTKNGKLDYSIIETSKDSIAVDNLCESSRGYKDIDKRGVVFMNNTIDGIGFNKTEQYFYTYGVNAPLRLYNTGTGKLNTTFGTSSKPMIVGNGIFDIGLSLPNAGFFKENLFVNDHNILTRHTNFLNFRDTSINTYSNVFRNKYYKEIETYIYNLKTQKERIDTNTYFNLGYGKIHDSLYIFSPYYADSSLYIDPFSKKKYGIVERQDNYDDVIKYCFKTCNNNVVLINKPNEQYLWYYKKNKKVFLSTKTNEIDNNLVIELGNCKSASYYLQTSGYKDYGSASYYHFSSILFFNETSNYLISQNFKHNKAIVWDISKGKAIDSFKNNLIKFNNKGVTLGYDNIGDVKHPTLEISPTVERDVILQSIQLSPKGKIFFCLNQEMDLANIIHISNVHKRLPAHNILAIDTNEIYALDKINDSTFQIINAVKGIVEKQINVKDYNIQSAFYSLQKKSFIGIATKNNNKELYLYIFKDGRILDLNKPCKNVQVLKPLED
jgi:hypothetical protein